jgi:hypothetical protein
MDEAYTLFLSLPESARISMRAAVNHKDFANLHKLTRTVYPYVQTLADAKSIAGFLAVAANARLDVDGPVDRKNEVGGSILRAWLSLHWHLHF